MHEFSVMSQIVASIMDEANARNASKIGKVTIELGEFTMLGQDQLRFAFEVLAKDTMLEGAVLDLQTTRGEIECSCGFKGEASPAEDAPHQLAASFECPKCGELAKVTGGRDCVIRNISMVVPGVQVER